MSTHLIQYARDLMDCGPCRLALVFADYEQARTGSAEIITVGDQLDGRRETYVALWRFMTDHAGHETTPVSEGDTHFADGTQIPADLHPQPEPPDIAGAEDQRATRRPGIPAAPTIDRPLHVPGWIRPAWLDYFLHYSISLEGWVLSAVSTVGNAVRHVELDNDDHLGRWFAGAAQDCAREHLETGVDEHDLRPAGVTEWRAVVYDDLPGWTPLFDTTDPARLPWTDLAAATGSRHHRRLTNPPPGIAGITGPATASDR